MFLRKLLRVDLCIFLVLPGPLSRHLASLRCDLSVWCRKLSQLPFIPVMASPAEPAHPLTPPAEANSQPTAAATQSSPKDNANRVEALLSEPLTSLNDNGTSKRPRDHRLIHLLLAAYGVSAYQERVPLQLMDFAYRYTSAVLGDALHVQNEGYDQAEGATTSKGRGGNKNQNKSEEGDISLASLRMSIQSRLGYQFSGSLPKEFLKQLADEKNRISLSTSVKTDDRSMVGGVKLPHDRYCLTGMSWGVKDEWDSEGEESVDEDITMPTTQSGDKMQLDGGVEGAEDEEELGTMEDVFGPETGDGQGDGDTEMQSF